RRSGAILRWSTQGGCMTKVTREQAAVVVRLEAGMPLHYREYSRRAAALIGAPSESVGPQGGLTPEQSMGAALSTSPLFVQSSKGPGFWDFADPYAMYASAFHEMLENVLRTIPLDRNSRMAGVLAGFAQQQLPADLIGFWLPPSERAAA